jgi:hypothetical protein
LEVVLATASFVMSALPLVPRPLYGVMSSNPPLLVNPVTTLEAALAMDSQVPPKQPFWAIPDISMKKKVEMRKEFDKYPKYGIYPTATKEDLIRHYPRAARGLLNYEKCNTAELERFVRARKLLPTGCKLVPRHMYIALLMTTDKEPKFSQFLELPSELRTIIYEYYVDSFSAEPTSLCRPPLAQMSRQLSKEVLPVFRERCMFSMTFCLRGPFKNGDPQKFLPCEHTQIVLDEATAGHSGIAKARFRLWVREFELADFTVDVGLNKKKVGRTIRITKYDSTLVSSQTLVEKKLRTILDTTETSGDERRKGFTCDELLEIWDFIEGMRRSL